MYILWNIFVYVHFGLFWKFVAKKCCFLKYMPTRTIVFYKPYTLRGDLKIFTNNTFYKKSKRLFIIFNCIRTSFIYFQIIHIHTETWKCKKNKIQREQRAFRRERGAFRLSRTRARSAFKRPRSDYAALTSAGRRGNFEGFYGAAERRSRASLMWLLARDLTFDEYMYTHTREATVFTDELLSGELSAACCLIKRLHACARSWLYAGWFTRQWDERSVRMRRRRRKYMGV